VAQARISTTTDEVDVRSPFLRCACARPSSRSTAQHITAQHPQGNATIAAWNTPGSSSGKSCHLQGYLGPRVLEPR